MLRSSPTNRATIPTGHVIVNDYIEGCSKSGIYMPTGSRHYGLVNYCVVAHNTNINCGRGLLTSPAAVIISPSLP